MTISKRVLSVILSVVMLLSIVPMSAFAVEVSTGESVSANTAMVDDGTGREIIPMATVTAPDIVRVAAASGSMAQGSTIVSATPSGVPAITSTYSAEAYAGETPSLGQITFVSDLSLANNKNVTISCSNNSSITFSQTNPNNNTWIWTITGGTAAAGSYLDFEIGYSYTYTDKLTGKSVTNNYVAYASSYVAGIIQPAGLFLDTHRTKSALHSAEELDAVYRILGLNTFGTYYGVGTGVADSSDTFKEDDSVWAHGYYDFVSMSAQGWGTSAANSTGYGLVLHGKDDGDGNKYTNTGVDCQRPVSTTYIDSSKGTALNGANINLRYAVMDLKYGWKEGDYIRTVRNIRVLPGESTWDSETTNNSTASNQLAFAGMDTEIYIRNYSTIPSYDYRLSNYGLAIPFNGTTYVNALTTLDDGTREVYYTFISELYSYYSKSKRLIAAHSAVDLHLVVYNKADLRGTIEDALDYYVPVDPLGDEMGIMPQARYYSAGWDAFKNALTNAQRISARSDVSQGEIDAAKTALETAMAGLVVKTADYSAVNTAINTASGLNADDYTTESWARVTTARNAVVLNYTTFYQCAVNKMATDLVAAIDALEYNPADYTNVDNALELVNDVDRSVYTDDSLAKLDALVTEANSTEFRSKNVTEQVYVDDMADKIIAAIDALEYKLADYTEVDKAVARYRAIDTSLYTDASYARVTAFYEQIVYNLNITMQSEVDQMAADLNNAIDNYLVYKTADYTAVDNAVAEYEELDSSLYTTDSWAALEDAVDAVEYDLDLRYQDDVDAYAAAINDAISKLQYTIGNYDKVSAALTKADALTESNYTPDSWANLQTAINNVQYGLTVDKQTQIDGYATAIEAAITALVPTGADYTAVDEAIAKYNALDTSLYTTASLLKARQAVNSVVRGYDITQQAEVDAMAQKIETALANLAYKAGDYTAVEAAKTAAQVYIDTATEFAAANNGYSYYTADSYKALTDAIAAVVYGLDVRYNEQIAGYATAINTAAGNLELNDADYSAVTAAKNAIPSDLTVYTDDSVASLNLAVNAVEEGLKTDEQALVNDYAAAIVAKTEALEYKAIDTTAYDEQVARIPADTSAYTADSVQAVTDAKAAADTFLAGDVNITHQAQLDALVATLKTAIDNLEVSAYFQANAASTCVINGNMIYGLEVRLTAAKLKSTYLDYEGVEVTVTPAVTGRYVGTGSTVTVVYPDGTEEVYTVVIFGDYDGNGQINVTDVSGFSSYFTASTALSAAQKKAMNLDGDARNRITTTDLGVLRSALSNGTVINQVNPAQ